jgi:major outer sheath protein
MKKYLLVSLTILFAATFVWAQETPTDPAPAEPAVAAPAPAKPAPAAPAVAAPAVAEPAVTEPAIAIEADATVSWGIDFGPGGRKHGFNNEASWKVKFPIYKKADRTSTKGNVPVYGEVSLKDVELNILSKNKDEGKFNIDGKVEGLEANLVFYGAYLSVFDKPDFSANYAQIWEPLEKNDDYDEDDFKFDASFDGYGTKLGYANKDIMDLDVGLKFGSDGNWKAKDAGDSKVIDYSAGATVVTAEKDDQVPPNKIWVNRDTKKQYGEKKKVPEGTYFEYNATPNKADSHSKYGIGFDLSIAPLDKMLGIALTVNSVLTPNYNKVDSDFTPNLNFGVEITSEPIDGLALKAGFDGMYVFNAEFDWDTVFTAQYKWVGAGVYVGSEGTLIGGYDADTNTRGIVDMAVFAQFETKGEKKDATNLVEGLDAGVYVGMYQLIANAKTSFPFFTKLWGAYKININDSMWVKPFADLWLETKGKDVALAYDVGVKFSPVEKVEVQAKWNQGTTKKNKYAGIIDKSALNGGHYGTFVLSLKVSY